MHVINYTTTRIYHAVSTSDEPDNPVDKNAIAFKCFLGNKWHKFGYATTEVLDELHHANQSKSISNVTYKDIRFVGIWSRSAPGFYAAVNSYIASN